MANEQMGRDRDLVLPPNTYAYVLDSTKGKVGVYIGPYKNSLSNTDQIVTWDLARKRFVPSSDLDRAIQTFVVASEGQYVVLSNPSKDEKAIIPGARGTSLEAVDLEFGRKINVAGPVSFPLWPGQVANVVDGHHLRNNQYLLVRVYDENLARQNWKSAVVKTTDKDSKPFSAESLTMGQTLIVKGTDVSFFIPPTGIEVVTDDVGKFVREAVTLERLEYCILLHENGEKRYVRGPAVVFPQPTENFVTHGEDKKFLGLELNEHSGLYVKVIADYEDEDVPKESEGRFKKVGDELFITGKQQSIYFPRPEHSIVKYGEKKIHYAIAIPAGEGRYVLNRKNGTVDLFKGPLMFLPDPRTQVVVLRILDPQTVNLLYPGNREALEVNDRYKKMAEAKGGATLDASELNRGLLRSAAPQQYANQFGAQASAALVADSFSRGTGYTPPRTIVLDSKYEGAVAVNVWSGYAILVTKKTGERRVEIGPKMVLLDYDEMLMQLEMSTGRPKTDTRLIKTGYLKVKNNQVSDIISVETRDLVKLQLEVSYRVNFEGSSSEEQMRWFDVDNYVKILTDHGRSKLRNAAKRVGIQEFYSGAIDIVRDTILGKQEDSKRQGLSFVENGMRVYDVEVLNVTIEDDEVADLLMNAQETALTGAIKLTAAQEESERIAKLETLKRSNIEELEKTSVKESQYKVNDIARRVAIVTAEGDIEKSKAVTKAAAEEIMHLASIATRERDCKMSVAEAEVLERKIKADTESYVERVKALAEGPLVPALQNFGDKVFVSNLVEAVGTLAIERNTTAADIFNGMFKGTPLETVFSALAARPHLKKIAE